jgi:hypothetical protein
MIYVYALIELGCLTTISIAIDSIAMYRSLSGCNGEAVLTAIRDTDTAERVGGVPRWVLSSLALDIIMPWLTFQGLLIAYREK